jgi:hypothetical protein
LDPFSFAYPLKIIIFSSQQEAQPVRARHQFSGGNVGSSEDCSAVAGGMDPCCCGDSKPGVSTRFSLLSVTVKSLKSVCANTRKLKVPVPLVVVNIDITIIMVVVARNIVLEFIIQIRKCILEKDYMKKIRDISRN